MNAKLTIKNHKVQINNNLMTGDTYAIKDWIKSYLCGKWDGEHKGWIVDLGQVNVWMTGKYPIIKIDETVSEVHNETKINNGLCPHCHTYCYGDCTAH